MDQTLIQTEARTKKQGLKILREHMKKNESNKWTKNEANTQKSSNHLKPMIMKSITNYWTQIRFNGLIQYKCATEKHSLSFGLWIQVYC